MICAVCYGVLRGHQGAQWRGTYDLHFDHHVDRAELEKSAKMSCCICRSLLREISRVEKKNQQGAVQRSVQRAVEQTVLDADKTIQELTDHKDDEQYVREGNRLGGIGTLIRLVIDKLYGPQQKTLDGQSSPEGQRVTEQKRIPEDVETSRSLSILGTEKGLVSAYLSEIYDKLYRLDFKWKDSENVGTFILQKTSEDDTARLHTPFSYHTSSDEVLQLAKRWIRTCRSGEHPGCPGESVERKWYPARLIDLGEVDPYTGEWPEVVRLILSHESSPKDFYVTLSHCWGNAQFLRLSPENMDEFRRGIEIKSLPKTFRHAVDFARRLGSVPTFRPREDPSIPLPTVRYIWIDSLCIIQGPSESARRDWLAESADMYQIYNNSYCNLSATAAANSGGGLYSIREPHTLWEDEINLNVEGIPATLVEQNSQPSIQRCVIQDLSFWARTIDEAPVNRRGWVLQERLMAPRVLHFCENQIAWECSQLEAAESARDGVPSLRLRPDNKLAEDSIKTLLPDLPGDPNSTSATTDDALEHWQTVIERYSKTQLTNAEDKLIALSGFAKMRSLQLPNTCTYLAGMWRDRLASQLLWRVDPVFANGCFEYPSTRPNSYRAPTWSWASVNTPQGITCGVITDEGILITVENPIVDLVTDNEFGLVRGGRLDIKGMLKQVELRMLGNTGTVRYGWKLVSRVTVHGASPRMHTIVYLDSPSSEVDMLGGNGRVYCLPARKEPDGYLVCLLLQLERQDDTETGNYRRIGLTKISPYERTQSGVLEQSEVLKQSGDEPSIPYGNWNARIGKHTICLV